MWQQLWQGLIEPGTQWLYIYLLVAFILGLLIGRAIRANRNREHKYLPGKSDRAFFKGVQYILSNDRDQAIEEFTKSVQINSDTIETYITLGNLYRSRGDFERAIRIIKSRSGPCLIWGWTIEKGALSTEPLTHFLKSFHSGLRILTPFVKLNRFMKR